MTFPLPSEDNAFLAEHIRLLRNSYHHWTRRDFVHHRMSDEQAARYLYTAPFAVASHDTSPDPIFNYANQTTLSLFGMSWQELTAIPSRLSAEKQNREEREKLLAEVSSRGYVEGYAGVRVGRHGHRFAIEDATVWNLLDDQGMPYGQAVWFKHWKLL